MNQPDVKTAADTAVKSAEAPHYPELFRVSPSPHIKNPDSTRSIMLDVVIALMPALAWAVWNFGWRSLSLTLISVAAAVGFEALYCRIAKKPIPVGDLSAVVTGILIAFNLPVSAPLWMPVAGAFFAIVIVKQLFGGIGKNFVNPALAARVFLFLSWSEDMTTFPQAGSRLSAFSITADSASLDAVASATPLRVLLKSGELSDKSVLDMLIGNTGGCIGEVSALLILAGGIYLLCRRVITWHIPVAFIGTMAVLTFVFSKNADSLNFMLGELLSGGLMLGAVFMATDYATSPVTKSGRLIFGVGCGLITFFIRYFGGFPDGVSFAILIMNLLCWYIDKLTRPKRFGYAGLAEKKEETKNG